MKLKLFKKFQLVIFIAKIFPKTMKNQDSHP